MKPGKAAPEPAPAENRARERGIRLGLCAAMSLWVFAFAPHPQVIATLPGLVAGLALVERCKTTKQTLLWVAGFAAVAIGFGYRWIGETARTFGELDTRLGSFGGVAASWVILGAYGIAGTVHGLLFAVLHRATIGPTARPHPAITAALFVACELLPVRFLPWMAGYGAAETPWIRQVAQWGGVPFVSFTLLCLTIPVHELLRARFAKTGAPARKKAAIATLCIGIALTAAGAVSYMVVRSDETDAASAGVPHVRIGVVQSNVGAERKRDGDRNRGAAAMQSAARYRKGSEKAIAQGAEIVVWPETAVNVAMAILDPKTGAPRPPAEVTAELRRAHVGFLETLGRDRPFLLGAYLDEAGPGGGTLRYNAAALREAGGEAWGVYRKVRLIPFGESMPLSGLFPALKGVLPQGFEMTAGTLPQPPLRTKTKGLSIATFICYEDILPDDVRAIAGDERPNLLVNLSNDSWFGDSWEPWQHHHFARFRAVEHGVPLVRATNTGVSSFVTPAGDVTALLAVGVEDVLVQDVPLVPRARTLYASTGGLQRWGWWLAGVVGFVLARRRAKRAPAAA